ncbi:hypothetical protein [Zavarzinella formosa]|uniref:hypothetical protein n=1 Tax=Zavarzinella formosa TaxID=360055 RepID=UPI000314D59D|nr:hypothetical protein [Zavarzinella formosa]
MNTGTDQFIGNGMYTVAEAALYAGVRTRHLNRWIFGDGQSEAILRPQFDGKQKYVSFLDFIQALAIKEIRLQRKIHPRKFRQAIELAASRGVEYPFARKHFTYLFGDDLLLKFPNDGIIEASGQRMLTFVEAYMHDLSFGPDGLANKFMIHESNGVKIVMAPEVRFGEPLLPSGYSARTIWDSIKAEGGINEAAREYGIPAAEALAAYKFFSQRLGAIA